MFGIMPDLLLGLFILIIIGVIIWHYFKNGSKINADPISNPKPSLTPAQIAQLLKQTEAETEELKKNYQQKLDQITNHFNAVLDQTLKTLTTNLTLSMQSTQTSNTQSMAEIQKQIVDWQEAIESEIKYKLNNFLERFESNMSQFFINAEQKSQCKNNR